MIHNNVFPSNMPLYLILVTTYMTPTKVTYTSLTAFLNGSLITLYCKS